ncbi:dihydroxyacetone kinase subunit DhaK [Vagococcus salmoninarum]|uniref:dihydroxyacetone kinase subunit DhaK n=1 Tax=Vagococcus salmoninarum TaxID=2739 RepID=UPI0028D44594|nr:dihydroxyacetone kinase subunit DhaK [Vagococcus salmoninarum]
MRRLLNDGYEAVEEMLAGYCLAHSEHVYLLENDQRVVVSRHLSQEPRVRIIVGGGSGHEPLFLGYVGKDFADAAVIGNVNTSPSPEPCYQAVKAVDSGRGCLYLYGNYAGDVMNFDMGAELAAEDGIQVETVLVTDDVYSAKEVSERRGVAGDIIVFKVASGAAAQGYDLAKVKALAEKSNSRTYSMGVALSSSTLPVTGEVIFEMADGEMEVGMGIHGEPGIERTALATADEVVEQLLSHILAEAKLAEGADIHVLVNGLGGLPLMDQYISYRRVVEILEEEGFEIASSQVGNYATSMDMIGLSITIVDLDEEIKGLLAAPCDTPYWRQ